MKAEQRGGGGKRSSSTQEHKTEEERHHCQPSTDFWPRTSCALIRFPHVLFVIARPHLSVRRLHREQ